MTSEGYEGWIAFVAAQLGSDTTQHPAPDGSIYFTGGDPPLVIARVTRSTVTVWEYAATWEGGHNLAVVPVRIGSIVWRPLSESAAIAVVSTLIDAARESRLGKFRVCRFCNRRTPPELLHDDDVCQACAQEHLGVVY